VNKRRGHTHKSGTELILRIHLEACIETYRQGRLELCPLCVERGRERLRGGGVRVNEGGREGGRENLTFDAQEEEEEKEN
jgi:hypothetical protein